MQFLTSDPHYTGVFKFCLEGRWAGRAGGPCFQMKNANFWRAAQKTEGRPADLHKGAGWAAENGIPPARPFPQPSLMCSPPARLNVQLTGPSCNAAR